LQPEAKVKAKVFFLQVSRELFTFIAKNDGDRDHNHARAGPDVVHKELLEHDVPKALTEKQRHLIANGLVSTIQVVQFNLEK